VSIVVVAVIFAVVVLAAFVSDFFVTTITGIATAAMTKTLTILMKVIHNKFLFQMTSTLKRKSIFFVLHFEYKKQHTLLFLTTSWVLHLYLSP